MNHGPDPQLCTMSDAEEGFRNTLREVFGSVEWDVTEVTPRRIHASIRDGLVEVTVDRDICADQTLLYAVTLGELRGAAYSLQAAAKRARSKVSDAVRALQSVGMEVEP